MPLRNLFFSHIPPTCSSFYHAIYYDGIKLQHLDHICNSWCPTDAHLVPGMETWKQNVCVYISSIIVKESLFCQEKENAEVTAAILHLGNVCLSESAYSAAESQRSKPPLIAPTCIQSGGMWRDGVVFRFIQPGTKSIQCCLHLKWFSQSHKKNIYSAVLYIRLFLHMCWLRLEFNQTPSDLDTRSLSLWKHFDP